jgi:hypothetical protein
VGHAQRAFGRLAYGPIRKARRFGKPKNPKADLRLPFKSAVPQQMRIHRALVRREPQLWHRQVFHLFPHFYRIDFSVFHEFDFLFEGCNCKKLKPRFRACLAFSL